MIWSFRIAVNFWCVDNKSSCLSVVVINDKIFWFKFISLGNPLCMPARIQLVCFIFPLILTHKNTSKYETKVTRTEVKWNQPSDGNVIDWELTMNTLVKDIVRPMPSGDALITFSVPVPFTGEWQKSAVGRRLGMNWQAAISDALDADTENNHPHQGHHLSGTKIKREDEKEHECVAVFK